MRPKAQLADVVLSGAGISLGSPAKLPSPWHLMEAVWDAIRHHEPGVITPQLTARVFDRLGEPEYTVRMEQFLDALSGPDAIPSLVLAEVYKLVASRTPNDSHLRLAALPVQHFTVNMDKLLEEARARKVHHLHGTWDRPKSIKTTIEHYAHGLAPVMRRQFARAIAGRRLLVIGYSGQDIDVMPIIEHYPPAHIVWVAPTAYSLELEASALQEHRRKRGLAFEPQALTADDYLSPILPRLPRRRSRASTLPSVDLAAIFYERTTHTQRMLGVAQLLITIGLNEDALAILSLRATDDLRATKLRARVLAQEGEPQDALKVLLEARGFAAKWELAGSVASIARRAQEPQAERSAKRLLATQLLLPGARRQRSLVRVERGKSMAINGDVARAAHLIGRVTLRADASRVLSPPNLVDALTWHADAVKDGGRLNEARRLIGRAEQLSPYGDASQRAYVHWKRTEIDLLGGRTKKQITDDGLSRALHFADRSGNIDTQAWIRGTSIEYLARHDLVAAREQAELALSIGADAVTRAGHGPAYFALQRAILAAAEEDLDRARTHLSTALSLAEQRDLPTLQLQAEHFSLYLRWLHGERKQLRNGLLRVAHAAQQRGIPLVAARARAGADHVIGRQSSSRMLTRAQYAEWDSEDFTARMAEGGDAAGFYLLV